MGIGPSRGKKRDSRQRQKIHFLRSKVRTAIIFLVSSDSCRQLLPGSIVTEQPGVLNDACDPVETHSASRQSAPNGTGVRWCFFVVNPSPHLIARVGLRGAAVQRAACSVHRQPDPPPPIARHHAGSGV